MAVSTAPSAARYALGPTPPLVSIILVLRNHAQYVREALASVAAQTYPNIELIVIVEGSEDAMPQIIEATLADFGRDMRVAFTTQDGTSPATAFNRALDLAQGDFVQFIASGDAILQEMTSLSVDALLDSPPDVGAVYCDGYLFDERSRRRGQFSARHPVPLGKDVHRELLIANWVPATGILYRRDILSALGGFDSELALEHWDLLLRLTREHRILRFPEKLFLTRTHAGQAAPETAPTTEAKTALAKEHADMRAYHALVSQLRKNPARAAIRHRANLDLILRVLGRKLFSDKGIQGETLAGAIGTLAGLLLDRITRRMRAGALSLRGIRLGKGCKVAGRMKVSGNRRNLAVGSGVVFEGDVEFILPRGRGQGRIVIGDGCAVAPGAVFQCMGGTLELGPSSYVGRNVILQSNGDLKIGSWCLFAANAGVYASNHVTSDKTQPFWAQGNSFRGITIGDNCWIGHGAVVVDGTELGPHSIVGPNMVLRGSHKPGSRVIAES